MKRAVIALIVMLSTVAVTPSVPTSAAWVSMYQVDTGTSCASGRVCVTRLAVSSCGGTNNRCARYNANGSSSDGASLLDTAGNTFSPLSGTVKVDADRAYNNNSGTQRRACMFRLTYWGGSYQTVYYAGWAVLPFSGVGSMATVPLGWTCYDLVAATD